MCAKQEGSLYPFYDGLWYDPAGTRTTKPTRGGLYVYPTYMIFNIFYNISVNEDRVTTGKFWNKVWFF